MWMATLSDEHGNPQRTSHGGGHSLCCSGQTSVVTNTHRAAARSKLAAARCGKMHVHALVSPPECTSCCTLIQTLLCNALLLMRMCAMRLLLLAFSKHFCSTLTEQWQICMVLVMLTLQYAVY